MNHHNSNGQLQEGKADLAKTERNIEAPLKLNNTKIMQIIKKGHMKNGATAV